MMHFAFRPVFGTFFSCIALVALACPLVSQQPGATIAATAAGSLPEAPQPPIAPGAVELPDQQSSLQQIPAQTPAAQGSSSSQAPAPPPDAEKSEREKAEEQLKAQEHQRVMGVMATFNTTSNRDALPLSPKQKFELFFKSETDPWPFLLSSVVAGIGQADDSYEEWGQAHRATPSVLARPIPMPLSAISLAMRSSPVGGTKIRATFRRARAAV